MQSHEKAARTRWDVTHIHRGASRRTTRDAGRQPDQDKPKHSKGKNDKGQSQQFALPWLEAQRSCGRRSEDIKCLAKWSATA